MNYQFSVALTNRKEFMCKRGWTLFTNWGLKCFVWRKKKGKRSTMWQHGTDLFLTCLTSWMGRSIYSEAEGDQVTVCVVQSGRATVTRIPPKLHTHTMMTTIQLIFCNPLTQRIKTETSVKLPFSNQRNETQIQLLVQQNPLRL